MVIVLVLLLAVLANVVCALNEKKQWYNDLVDICSLIVAIIGYVAVVVMLIIVFINYIQIDAYDAGFQKHYEILVYQLENNLYDNDNDYGKKELYDQIKCWNYDLAKRKALSKNILVGVFWPNDYDKFEFIDPGDYQ